ncbi:hypothetical protein [Methanobacterium sp.]|uniref:hypothetical protein n=1 Tax=Methanobacterium sp. TaxID=2164 RepID=UPI003D64875A
MSKTFQVSTFSTMGHGGGTIKRRKTCALLLTLAMAMCILPSIGGTSNQIASDKNANIGLNENTGFLEVNAASKSVKAKSTKKTSKKRVKAKSTKKVKATKKTKKVKVRYKYKGKWKYKWVTKSYNSVSAASSYSSSSYRPSATTGSWSDDPTLNGIMVSGSRFGYSGAHHTGAELEQYGAGDCWAMSDWLNTKFQAAGYESRVIQYATSYSSQHRSVQVKRNGQWETAPYRSYGYHYLFV